jgi:reactive chlorine resistance protein C
MRQQDVPSPSPAANDPARARALQRAGLAVLRYGLVLLLVMWGAFKFTAFEAEGIRPLVSNSPILSWLYALFGARTVSALFGVFEIATGLLIATRRWLPRASGLASVAASAMFVITLSFLFTTPGVLAPDNPAGGFLMKDILLLGAALSTAGEALVAHDSRSTARA